MLFGGGNDLFQKVRDALPIVFMGDSTFVPHRDTFPIILQLERIADDASASSGLPVPAIWDHFTVIGNKFHANLSCLPNIPDNDVNLALSFGPLAKQIDVTGVHADRFKNDAVCVAVVLHSLQVIRVPSPFWILADFRSEVLHAVTQVVFEILFGGDVTADDDVVVAAYVHEGVPLGFLLRREGVRERAIGNALGRDPNKRATELSSIDHG